MVTLMMMIPTGHVAKAAINEAGDKRRGSAALEFGLPEAVECFSDAKTKSTNNGNAFS